MQKLKEVNGVKTHNLRLENKSERNGPIIYINNPVEAGMPNPFLNIDQFKTAMYERVKRQKKEFFANSNPLIKTEKFKVFKHLEVVPTTLFDVKKYVKQLADPSNNMNTRGIYKANKKRTQKVYFSHATKSKTKARIVATAALPKETNSNTFETIEEQRTTHDTVEVSTSDRELSTETIVVKKITTETPVAEEVINKTESDHKTTIPTTVGDEITTEIPVGEKETNKTESIERNTTQTTVDHEKSSEAPFENGITTETLIDEVKNDTTAVEENNTETIISKEVITEMTTQEEIITEPVTTTESTVRTKRTKQLVSIETVCQRSSTYKLPLLFRQICGMLCSYGCV